MFHRNGIFLAYRLFGDDAAGEGKSQMSPSAGWAKFKESNPDEFRTPMQHGGEGLGGPSPPEQNRRDFNNPRKGGEHERRFGREGGFGRQRGGMRRNQQVSSTSNVRLHDDRT